MKRHFPFLIAFCTLFTAIGLYFGVKYTHPSPAPDSAVALFSQALPDSKGQVQSLAQWKNKPLLINFWAPWCPPCVQEMPELSKLQIELTPKNIQILGIGIDSAAKIQAFSAQYPVTYPLYVAGIQGITLSEQLGNQTGGLPYTILVDAAGHIKKTYSGRLEFDRLRRDLAIP